MLMLPLFLGYLRFLLPSFLEAVLEAVRQQFFLKPYHSYKTEFVFFSYDRITTPLFMATLKFL